MAQTITLPFLKMGTHSINELNVAILSEQSSPDRHVDDPIGVIGLDILADFRILIDPGKQNILLIDSKTPPIELDRSWRHVSMIQSPYGKNIYRLHFVEVKVNGTATYALLDTGTEYNMMNWKFKNLWQLKEIRRSLKSDWEHRGAKGPFNPKALAELSSTKSSNYDWGKQTFLVFDFKTFHHIGLKEKPLMIVGIPFLKNRAAMIDFPNNKIWLRETNY